MATSSSSLLRCVSSHLQLCAAFWRIASVRCAECVHACSEMRWLVLLGAWPTSWRAQAPCAQADGTDISPSSRAAAGETCLAVAGLDADSPCIMLGSGHHNDLNGPRRSAHSSPGMWAAVCTLLHTLTARHDSAVRAGVSALSYDEPSSRVLTGSRQGLVHVWGR